MRERYKAAVVTAWIVLLGFFLFAFPIVESENYFGACVTAQEESGADAGEENSFAHWKKDISISDDILMEYDLSVIQGVSVVRQTKAIQGSIVLLWAVAAFFLWCAGWAFFLKMRLLELRLPCISSVLLILQEKDGKKRRVSVLHKR